MLFRPLLALACSAGPAAAVAAPSTLADVWLFDQPSHGEYEAVEVSLFPDGHLAKHHVRGEGVEVVSQGAVRCGFGDRWRPGAGARLEVDGTCTDGVARSIVLDLTTAEPVVVSVGGETAGWSHPGWSWRALRCHTSPGMRCAEEPAPGAPIQPDRPIQEDSKGDLAALISACTGNSTPTSACLMLGQAIRHDDLRTLTSLVGKEVSWDGKAVTAAEFAERIERAGGVKAIFGDAVPRVVGDCSECARSTVMLEVAGANGMWAVMVEGAERISSISRRDGPR